MLPESVNQENGSADERAGKRLGNAAQMTTFSTLLRRLRRAAGLTQEELAEQANVSVYTISNFERGALRRPRRETLELLASALDLAADERSRFLSAGRQPVAPASQTGNGEMRRALMHPTPLIGRDADLERVAGYLSDPTGHLLTLVGPPGVGKTRVAVAAAEAWRNTQNHDSWFVSLSDIDHADAVIDALASSLGVLQGGHRSLREAVLSTLQEQRTLLVLDNFEHVMGAAPFVDDLLAACRHLRLLVTSRASLGLRGEQVYSVAPFGVACDPSAAQNPMALLNVPAIALFVERGRRAAPDFVPTPENSADVAAICAALDGLPLALELAAPHLRFLTPSVLLARLSSDALRLLRSGSRDLPVRQRTMEQTIRWSYELLTPAQQAVFRRLSVFYGGCELDAVRTVCGAFPSAESRAAEDAPASGSASAATRFPRAGGSDSDMLLTIETLLDHHLALRLTEATESSEHLPPTPLAAFEGAAPPSIPVGEELRITMLHVIREFSRSLLLLPEHAAEARAARRAHAVYYLELAERAERGLGGPHQAYWIERIGREHDNFLAALEWAMRIALDDETYSREAPPVALRVGAALWRYWYLKGRLREGRRWLEAAHTLCQTPGNASLETHGETYGETHERTLAEVCDALSALAARHGNDQTAQRTPNGDRLNGWPGAVDATSSPSLGAGGVTSCIGDYATALADYDACLSLRNTLGDHPDLAAALFNLAAVTPEQDEFARAQAVEEASLAVRRGVGDHAGVAACLAHLGTLEAIRRDFAQAIEQLRECVRSYESLGDANAAAYARYNLGSVLLEHGDLAGAQTATTTALASLHAQGEPRARAFAAFVMGQQSPDNRRFWDAATRYREGLALVQSLGERAMVLQGLVSLGDTLRREGLHAEAAHQYRESLILARQLGNHSVIAPCLEGVAGVLVALAHEGARRAACVRNESSDLTGVPPVLDGAVTREASPGPALVAVLLLGAADRLRNDLGAPISPLMRAALERAVSAVRATYAQDGPFTDRWAAGHALSDNDAISVALASLAQLESHRWNHTAPPDTGLQ